MPVLLHALGIALGIIFAVGSIYLCVGLDVIFKRKSKNEPSIQERTIEVMRLRNVHLIAQNVILNEILIELKNPKSH